MVFFIALPFFKIDTANVFEYFKAEAIGIVNKNVNFVNINPLGEIQIKKKN
jgi:hypothetical protein